MISITKTVSRCLCDYKSHSICDAKSFTKFFEINLLYKGKEKVEQAGLQIFLLLCALHGKCMPNQNHIKEYFSFFCASADLTAVLTMQSKMVCLQPYCLAYKVNLRSDEDLLYKKMLFAHG